MPLSFEDLKVWQIALEFSDHAYDIALALPAVERFNLADQLRRACNSIGLNIAEGSIARTKPDQARFITYAIGSTAESVAALRLIERRAYKLRAGQLNAALDQTEKLFAHLIAFRRALLK